MATQLSNLEADAAEFIKENPEFENEVLDLVQLCYDNIEEGESITHEIELCKGSINDLIL